MHGGFAMLSMPSQYSLQGWLPQFGQPGLFGGYAAGHEQSPFPNPYLHHPLSNPAAGYYASAPQQILAPLIGQLAQLIATRGAVTQQMGITLQQLAQQLSALTTQPQHLTQPFGASPYIGAGVPGPNLPFNGSFGGFQPGFGAISPYGQAPYAQGWGAGRPTIQ